ncbi:citryl-CoA lyase [Actinoplanes sp. NPDC051513]|uniref:citryl-CoA lyase n=1 Tax=Actinoplanes sp. NPDC051513 TaxID=3363908 RepID=UPI0037A2C49C
MTSPDAGAAPVAATSDATAAPVAATSDAGTAPGAATSDATAREVAAWWGTSVSRIEPGVIELRGHPIQELIGTVGLAELIYLMLRGSRPPAGQAALLEAAMVAGADHGPHAPSIAIARMTATCGVGLANAMASGVNALGDVHGGAGQECLTLLDSIVEGADPAAVVASVRYFPGFGHRFHPVDPRREPMLALTRRAVDDGVVPGKHLAAALAVEEILGPRVPMNVDCLTAIVYGELGFAAPLARGLFALSRSIGILAHAWEETQQGRRIKGPIPPSILPEYRG